LMWGALSGERRALSFRIADVSPAQSLLVPRPADLIAILYCFRFVIPPNLGGQVPVFISVWNRMVQLYHVGIVFLFLRLLRLPMLRWMYLNPLPHWLSTDS
jgi:hypothetical protein